MNTSQIYYIYDIYLLQTKKLQAFRFAEKRCSFVDFLSIAEIVLVVLEKSVILGIHKLQPVFCEFQNLIQVGVVAVSIGVKLVAGTRGEVGCFALIHHARYAVDKGREFFRNVLVG